MGEKRNLFSVSTPIGERIALTRNRWREIIRFKHPAISKHLVAVRKCLEDPEIIRESVKDPTVHLYYRRLDDVYVSVVVGGNLDGRFVITAYLTEDLKKGIDLWTK